MTLLSTLIYPLFLSFFLALPRLYGLFILLPLVSKNLTGHRLVFHGIVLSLGLFVRQSLPDVLPALSAWDYFLIILKEFATGLLFSVIAVIPFWVAGAAGQCIDQQRGSTMGSMLNPLSGQQASLFGLFFNQYVILFYLTSGFFFQLLALFFRSFVRWPVLGPPAGFTTALPPLFFQLLNLYGHAVIGFALPLMIPMYLTELALGFINKFAPSLNVFVIAMPVKSAIALFIACGWIALTDGPLAGLIRHNFSLIQALHLPDL